MRFEGLRVYLTPGLKHRSRWHFPDYYHNKEVGARHFLMSTHYTRAFSSSCRILILILMSTHYTRAFSSETMRTRPLSRNGGSRWPGVRECAGHSRFSAVSRQVTTADGTTILIVATDTWRLNRSD